MRLRNRKSHLTTMPEGQVEPQKSAGISRIAYLTILAAAFFYLFYYLLTGFLHIQGRGYVAQTSRLIQSPGDCRVAALHVAIGDQVHTGQPLAEIVFEEAIDNNIWREALRLGKELETKELELNRLRATSQRLQTLSPEQVLAGTIPASTASLLPASFLRESRSYQERQIALDALRRQAANANTSPSGLAINRERVLELTVGSESDWRRQKKLRNDLAAAISQEEQWLQLQSRHLRTLWTAWNAEQTQELAKVEKDYQELTAQTATLPPMRKTSSGEYQLTLVAPAAGTIQDIYRYKGEAAGKRNVILSVMPHHRSTHIDAYFDLKRLGHIRVGKEATVIFPDGRKGQGIIRAVDSNAVPFPETEFSKYLPTEVAIRAEIFPLRPPDGQWWLGYQQMDILVKVSR